MKSDNTKNRYSAFSIIEVLVALFMFTTAIVLTVSLMVGEMGKSMEKRNETIAGQLSQEGIELVRNIRDNNWLDTAAPPVFADINTTTGSVNGTIDYLNMSKIKTSSPDYVLYVDSEGLYSHVSAGSSASVFQRSIIVSSPDSHQRRVTSAVTWGGGSVPMNESALVSCDAPHKCFFTQVVLRDEWGKVN